MTGRISTRPYTIRCTRCHRQGSRYDKTPWHRLKLPEWMLGWVIYESLERYPQVLTSTQIRNRLGVGKNTATRLKRRFQLFSSNQLVKIKRLIYRELEQDWAGHDFPRSSVDISAPVKQRKVVHADTCALFSASQTANQGRKRFKHSGLTASIYCSDNVKEGKQIGSLVQTLAWKGGPVIYDSVHNNRATSLMPLLDRYVPKDVGLFTDEGYRFYYRINKNHRMINHSRKSRDKRYRYARDRWKIRST